MESDKGMGKQADPIFIGDIGATHARFQKAGDAGLVGDPAILNMAAYDQTGILIDAALGEIGDAAWEGVLLAVAGPRDTAGNITVINTGLKFLVEDLERKFNCDVTLVNDFYALAHGVPHFKDLDQLGGGQPVAGNKVVLGPGTGLGVAALVPMPQNGWKIVASEAGHSDLAPGSPLEAELWGILAARHGVVCWETVLSGRGIVHLYEAMSALWGSASMHTDPGTIVALGSSLEDPVCHQTLESFCSLLGGVAGNLALTLTATGGVYIAGGIVPRMVDFVRSSPIRRRFDERGDLSDFVADIPLYIIRDEQPGLVGALHCALETNDRDR